MTHDNSPAIAAERAHTGFHHVRASRFTATPLVLAGIVLLAVACTTPERSRTDDGDDGGNNGGNNGGVGTTVTFSLVNDGVLPLQLTGTTVTHADGTPLPTGNATCERICGDQGPVGCTHPQAEFDPAPIEIMPGESFSGAWDGTYAERSEDDDGSCVEPGRYTSGSFVVTMCWGQSRGLGQGCESAEFAFSDEDQTVELHAVGVSEPSRTEIEIVLLNEGDEVIEAYPQDFCGSSGFFSIIDPSGVYLASSVFCGPCPCSEGYSCDLACPAIACEAPAPTTLEPGQRLSAFWDGTVVEMHSSVHRSEVCTAAIEPPEGSVIHACYTFPGGRGEECLEQAITPELMAEGVIEFVVTP